MFSTAAVQAIDRVVTFLLRSRSVLFITGAGLSADSGLPTYRGIGGLYQDTATEEGHPIEEILSGVTFGRRPELTWKYVGAVERACRAARFNRGHAVIAEMEAHFERVWTLTQNIDGLHRQAGSRNLIDIHGDLHDLRCVRCGFQQTVDDYAGLTIPPRCLDCAGPLRPDIVLFGEPLPDPQVAQLHEQLARGFDLIFTIGTSSVFPYIAEPVEQASRRGVPTVEINPSISEVSELVTVKLALGAALTLDAIWQRYQSQRR